MIKCFAVCWLVVLCPLMLTAQTTDKYGDNKEVGKFAMINGVKLYYEVYGSGAPLLLVHGNTTGIKGWAAQIEYFSKKYKVLAIECRGRGKSELGKDSLTYMQQAKDMAAFIQYMKLDSVYVIGKSDGAIVGILMGIYFPDRIKKIVSFSANMWPDTTAMYPETVANISGERLKAEKMLAIKDTTKNWYLQRQLYRLMEFQPHITAQDLHKINARVLVISTDRDLIKEEHTLFIYKNIPRANLCFIPGETHHVVRQNAAVFDAAVEKFLAEPYRGREYRFNN